MQTKESRVNVISTLNSLRSFQLTLEQLYTSDIFRNEQLSNLISQKNIGIVIEDSRYTILYMNNFLIERFGEHLGAQCYRIFKNLQEPCAVCPIKKILQEKKRRYRYFDIGKDGNLYRIIAEPFRINGISAVIEVMEHIPHSFLMRQVIHILESGLQHSSANEIFREDSFFRGVFEFANDAIIIADTRSGNILLANRSAEKLFGMPRDRITRMHQSQLHPPQKRDFYINKFRDHVCHGNICDFDAEIIDASGAVRPVCISASVISIKNRDYIIGIFSDISILKQIDIARQKIKFLEEEKKRMKTYRTIDEKTGVYTYNYLHECLHAEFRKAKSMNLPLSLVMVDIQGFVHINEKTGNRKADEILREFACLLVSHIRSRDIVCSLGGEEFIVVMPETDRKEAALWVKRMVNTVRTHRFGGPLVMMPLRISSGIITYPEDGITSCDEMLVKAENSIPFIQNGNIFAMQKPEDFVQQCFSSQKKTPEEIRMYHEITTSIQKITKKINQSAMDSVYALAEAVWAKDSYTNEHSANMMDLCALIGQELRLSTEEIENIRHAAILHDIGKIGIDSDILLKPGPLTQEEFETVKHHPQIGAGILHNVHCLRSIIPIVQHHHEKYNGTGYAWGLSGEEIPIGARIVAIADVYEALITDRPYRKKFSMREAKDVILQGRGTHFDERIVRIFDDIVR